MIVARFASLGISLRTMELLRSGRMPSRGSGPVRVKRGRITMRKLSAMMLMILMALVLVACGGGEDEEEAPVAVIDEPVIEETIVEETVEPTATELVLDDETALDATVSDVTVVADGSPTSAVIPADAAPGATPALVGTPPVFIATPIVVGTPEQVASPVTDGFPVLGVTPGAIVSPVADASPGAMASPVVVGPAGDATPGVMATPVSATPADGIVIVLPDPEDEATPAGDAAATFTLNGRVELAGDVNEAYVLTDDGCVGLGENADMREGRQIVVRSEIGTIIGVTMLEAADMEDECAWTFSVDVPESEFYAVSIPRKTELVFAHDDIEENDEEIRIVLP